LTISAISEPYGAAAKLAVGGVLGYERRFQEKQIPLNPPFVKGEALKPYLFDGESLKLLPFEGKGSKFPHFIDGNPPCSPLYERGVRGDLPSSAISFSSGFQDFNKLNSASTWLFDLLGCRGPGQR
jgi:hypothetical protein